MKKLLAMILVVISVFTCVMPAFAVEKEGNLKTEPYVYAIEPYSKEWFDLTTPERKEIFRIPKEVAENLSTEALVESILNNPYIVDLFAYGSLADGIKANFNVLSLDELYSRQNYEEFLLEYLNSHNFSEEQIEKVIELQNRIVEKGVVKKEDFFFDGAIDDDYTLFIEYNKVIVARKLLYFSVQSLNSQYTISDVVNSNQLYNIITPMGYAVPAIKDITWSQWEEVDDLNNKHAYCHSQIEAITEDAHLLVLYLGAQLIYNANPSYNCHSYALYNTSTSNTYWIPNPFRYYSDGTFVEVYNPMVGDRISYFANAHYTHSGIITGVSNTRCTVKSKWGTQGIFIHNETNCPYYNQAYIEYWR